MKPGKDLNMPTQNEIGCFLDEKLSKKVLLTDEDHSMYDHWEFISRRSFQEEVVEFLIIEEKLVRYVAFLCRRIRICIVIFEHISHCVRFTKSKMYGYNEVGDSERERVRKWEKE